MSHDSHAKALIGLALGLAIAGAAPSQCPPTHTIETFEQGSNEAGWAFIAGGDVIETSGGNPGAWLHQAYYDTRHRLAHAIERRINRHHQAVASITDRGNNQEQARNTDHRVVVTEDRR